MYFFECCFKQRTQLRKLRLFNLTTKRCLNSLLVTSLIFLILPLLSHACVSINKAFAFPFGPQVFSQLSESRHRPVEHQHQPNYGNEHPFPKMTPKPRPTTTSRTWPATRRPSITLRPTTKLTTSYKSSSTSSGSSSTRVPPTRRRDFSGSSLESNDTNQEDDVPRRGLYESITLDYVPRKKKPPQLRSDGDVIVTTTSGRISGIKSRVASKELVAFLGIPYAEPPVEHLRFKRTVPIKPWRGVYEAKEWSPHCVQHFEMDTLLARSFMTLEMSEDCLHLNIWAPSIDEESLKPVIVYLHGGGYKTGTANLDEVDGRMLAVQGDVMVVTFNYRVGALGFLDLEAVESPGNQGLWDCLAVIEWIKANAAAFGGDPNEITLAGHYSGAVTAGLFMILDRSKALFRRAILQSGSPLFQGITDGRENFRTSVLFVDKVMCNSTLSARSQLACLKNLTIEEIIDTQRQVLERDINQFAPNYCDQSLMPSISFFEAMRSPQVDSFFSEIEDVLLGSNQDELSLSLVVAFPDLFSPERIRARVNNVQELRELIVRVFSQRNGLEDRKAVEFMAEYFFEGNRTDTRENLIRQMYRVFGDSAIGCPVNILAEELSKIGKRVFVYEFSQVSKSSPWGSWMGVPFGEEQPFVFGHPVRHQQRYNKEDIEVSRRMMDIWSKFAHSGLVPNQLNKPWLPYTNDTQEFVKISSNRDLTFGSRATNEVCNLFRFTLVESNITELNCSFFEDNLDISLETTTSMFETTTLEPEIYVNLTGVATCELFTVNNSADEPAAEYFDHIPFRSGPVATSNTSVNFTCDDHEILIGSPVSYCTEFGNWTDAKPICKSKEEQRREIELAEFEEARRTKYFLLRHVVVCELFDVNASNPFDPLVRYEGLASYEDTPKIFAINGTKATFSCLPPNENETSVTLIGASRAVCGSYGLWNPTWKPTCHRESPMQYQTEEEYEEDEKPTNYADQIITATLFILFIGVAAVASYTSFGLFKKRWLKKKAAKEEESQATLLVKNKEYFNPNEKSVQVKMDEISLPEEEEKEEEEEDMADIIERPPPYISSESDDSNEAEEEQILLPPASGFGSKASSKKGSKSSKVDSKEGSKRFSSAETLEATDSSTGSSTDSEDFEVQDILAGVTDVLDENRKSQQKGYALMKLAMAMDLDDNMNEILPPMVDKRDLEEAVFDVPTQIVVEKPSKSNFRKKLLKRK